MGENCSRKLGWIYRHHFPPNQNITVTTDEWQDGLRMQQVTVVPSIQAFPAQQGQSSTFTVEVSYSHTVLGESVAVRSNVGTFTLKTARQVKREQEQRTGERERERERERNGNGTGTGTGTGTERERNGNGNGNGNENSYGGHANSTGRLVTLASRNSKKPKPSRPVVPLSYSNNRPVLQSRNVMRRMLRSGLRPF